MVLLHSVICVFNNASWCSCCCVAVQDAVRRNPESSRATDNEVENEMKLWLKFAKDRDGGRRQRYQRMLSTGSAS